MKWTVKKGEFDYSPKPFRFHRGITSAVYEVTFNDNCLYEQLDWENDWNKLCGWSYGILPKLKDKIYGKGVYLLPAHHVNSVRVVFRPATWLKRMELALYVYDHEERRISEQVEDIPLNTPVRLELSVSGGLLRLTIQHNLLSKREPAQKLITMPYNVPAKWGYMLNPFFGGSNPAPHDMHLHLTRLQ